MELGITSLAQILESGALARISDADALSMICAAPISHASSGNTYGLADASNYGHAKASSSRPAANSGTGSVGTTPTVFALSDHVHPLQENIDGVASLAGRLQYPRRFGLIGGATAEAKSFDGSDDLFLRVTRLDPYALDIPVPLEKGGTGATSAAGALSAIGAAPASHTHTAVTLASLGLTATAAELNKCDGLTATTTQLNYCGDVTSAIQAQLDGKASSTHEHSLAEIGVQLYDRTVLDSKATEAANQVVVRTFIPKTRYNGSYIIYCVNATGNVDAKLSFTVLNEAIQNASLVTAGSINITSAKIGFYSGSHVQDNIYSVCFQICFDNTYTAPALDFVAHVLASQDAETVFLTGWDSTYSTTDVFDTLPGEDYDTITINKVFSLESLGLTATATELNYCDGVTSAIQAQLNGKAPTSHAHNYLPLTGGNVTGNITLSSGKKLNITGASGVAHYVSGEMVIGQISLLNIEAFRRSKNKTLREADGEVSTSDANPTQLGLTHHTPGTDSTLHLVVGQGESIDFDRFINLPTLGTGALEGDKIEMIVTNRSTSGKGTIYFNHQTTSPQFRGPDNFSLTSSERRFGSGERCTFYAIKETTSGALAWRVVKTAESKF